MRARRPGCRLTMSFRGAYLGSMRTWAAVSLRLASRAWERMGASAAEVALVDVVGDMAFLNGADDGEGARLGAPGIQGTPLYPRGAGLCSGFSREGAIFACLCGFLVGRECDKPREGQCLLAFTGFMALKLLPNYTKLIVHVAPLQ